MSLSQSRAVLRRPQFLFRQRFAAPSRNASTTEVAKEKASEASSKASEVTSNATSKASEGLTRVSSSANSVANRASGAASGGIGRAIGFVQSLYPPTVYYSKVGLELGKMIVENRKMALPSGAQFQQYWNSAMGMVRNPSSIMSAASSTAGSIQPAGMLQRARNLNREDLQGVGVIAAEVLGFFTVGTMIGRLKIIGYRSSGEAAHH